MEEGLSLICFFWSNSERKISYLELVHQCDSAESMKRYLWPTYGILPIQESSHLTFDTYAHTQILSAGFIYAPGKTPEERA